jgi:D-amino-acid dehydrogenase
MPLVGGRGYSITTADPKFRINYPAVFVESRIALTPMDGNKTRFGGTMEITSTNTPPRLQRVQGIIDGVKRFYPEFDIPMPEPDKVWYGFRPCSADGLPYIGKANQYKNFIVATGHSMLGMSLGAGTGKLVQELISGEPLSMDITPFDPNRFA